MARRRRDREIPKNPRSPLTDEQADQLRRVLLAGATRDEAAALVGIRRRLLDTRLRDQLADVRVGQGRQRLGRKRGPGGRLLEDWPELTDQEIEQRKAQVRASWTEAVRQERWNRNFSGPIPDE